MTKKRVCSTISGNLPPRPSFLRAVFVTPCGVGRDFCSPCYSGGSSVFVILSSLSFFFLPAINTPESLSNVEQMSEFPLKLPGRHCQPLSPTDVSSRGRDGTTGRGTKSVSF